MLEEKPFSSCKGFYHHSRTGKATRLQTLRGKHDLKQFYFRWAPHALSINQKKERLLYSKFLLTVLIEQKASGFQQIIAGDASWPFRCYLCDSVSAASRDEVSQSIKHKIETEKCLVSVPWSVNAIPSLLMPRGTTYSTAFFTDAVMPSLIENVRGFESQTAATSSLKPRPGPTDFFLFGHIKGKLSNYNCTSRDDLLKAATEIFTGVDQEVLFSVFES
jgi:hypothetical protein